MAENGFIDLRIGHGVRGLGDDSVWPSFSDIMTVVVMIFLMALIIIMVRNSSLNRQLLNSMDINQAISSDNLGLTSELSALKNDLQAVQKALTDSNAANQVLNERLDNEIARSTELLESKQWLEQEVSSLTELRAELSERNLELLAQRDQLRGENRALTEENVHLQDANEALELRLGQLSEAQSVLEGQRDELIRSRDLLATEKAALEQERQGLTDERDSLQLSLEQVSEERSALQVQRDELIRSRDLLATEKAALEQAKQDLTEEKETLESSLGQLETRHQMLETDRQALVWQSESLALSKVQMEQEKQALIEEVDTLLSVRRRLQGELASLQQQNLALEAERSALVEDGAHQQTAIESLTQQERLLSGQLAEVSRQLEELTSTSAKNISHLMQRNLSLTVQLDEVNLKLAQLNLELDRLKKGERALQGQLAERNEQLEELQVREQLSWQQLSVDREKIENLSRQIRERERENRALQADAENQRVRFASLQEEYESLEERYRGLIRAARSPVGKEVTQVYFRRRNDGYEYRLTRPGETESRVVSRPVLEQQLTRLKERHGRNLYTQVIIPENSDLSHKEAWNFTQYILNNFDYYSQPVEQENP